MVNSADFTKRLEKILDYYGLSATAFSEKIEFNRSTISHLISGRNKPSLEFVLKVVETFPEVTIYWLLNGKGNFPPSTASSKTSTIVHSNKVHRPEEDFEKRDTKNVTAPVNPLATSVKKNTAIERIIIFYADGSFKEYLP